MKTKNMLVVLFCAISQFVQAQNLSVEEFLKDEKLQDEIISAIVPNHGLMTKLIGKIAENKSRHQMLVQHLTQLLNENSGGAGDSDQEKMKSAYVGFEKREIKALSETDIQALLNGEGISTSLPAELNHHPGPRHALDFGDKLRLQENQRKSLQDSFDRMHAQAVKIGRQIIEQERALDKAFVTKTVDRESLKSMTAGLAALRGQLRFTHLTAHLEASGILTPQQIKMYDELRGYRPR